MLVRTLHKVMNGKADKKTGKKIAAELKAFIKHCLLFGSNELREWVLGVFLWLSLLLFLYGMYNLITLHL